MKWMVICMTVFCTHVSASVWSQTITFSGKKVPLERIFTEIKRQTGYSVFCNAELLDKARPVTVDAKEQKLTEFLETVLKEDQLEFEMTKTSIVISVRNAPPPRSQVTGVTANSAVPPPMTVNGRVINEKGEPLIGVSVMIKGTKRGATTNKDGEFVLNGVESDAVLVISATNIETTEVNVSGRTSLSIGAKTKVSKLDETVVIAYGTTSNRYSVGNVATVSGEDIAKSPVSNPLLALQGRVPGIVINQNSGMSGGGIDVTIQGRNSLDRGSFPFYVIDGVPYASQLLPNLGGTLGSSGPTMGTPGNPMSFINPSDIESVSILKDADATAIYGSRAANGAILITTKRAKSGAMRTDINVRQGWSRVSRFMKLLNTPQYLTIRHEAMKADGVTPGPTDYDVNGFWDTTRNVDWQKELLGGTAKYTNLYAAISGGTSTAQYQLGTTYQRETFVYPSDFANQSATIHFSLNAASQNQRFKALFTGSYQAGLNRQGNSDLANYSNTLPPDAPALFKADGSLNWETNANGAATFYNPLAYIKAIYKNKSSNAIGSMNLSYLILPGLEFRTSAGYNRLQTNETTTNPLTAVKPDDLPYSTPGAAYGYNIINSWIVEPQVSYRRDWGVHALEALIASTIQQNYSEVRQFSGSGYNSDAVLENILAASRVDPIGSLVADYKYNALFGKFNYRWQRRYLLDASVRRDGSSRFGPANRFHNFWSVGAGWIFSEADWIKQHVPLLSFGKLRASYGTTGSDQISDYQYLSLYNSTSVGQPYQGVQGLTPAGISNPYLQWEETRKASLGLDLGFFHDRLFVTATVYRNRSSNQLQNQALPIMDGFSSVTVNLGAVIQNAGVELTVTGNVIQGKQFSWTTNFNIAINRNKLVAYPGLESSSARNQLFIGKSISIYRTYHSLGVDPETGRYQFVDSKGNKTFSPSWTDDRTSFVDFAPAFTGGWGNTITYKSFSLDMLFQFVKQQKSESSKRLGSVPGAKYNQPEIVMQRWQKPGDHVPIQRLGTQYWDTYGSATASDLAYHDVSYVKLRNLSLSWRVPGAWKNRSYIKDLHLNLQGQNLLTITRYYGMDPETSYGAMPSLRTYAIGLQMTF